MNHSENKWKDKSSQEKEERRDEGCENDIKARLFREKCREKLKTKTKTIVTFTLPMEDQSRQEQTYKDSVETNNTRHPLLKKEASNASVKEEKTYNHKVSPTA